MRHGTTVNLPSRMLSLPTHSRLPHRRDSGQQLHNSLLHHAVTLHPVVIHPAAYGADQLSPRDSLIRLVGAWISQSAGLELEETCAPSGVAGTRCVACLDRQFVTVEGEKGSSGHSQKMENDVKEKSGASVGRVWDNQGRGAQVRRFILSSGIAI